MKFISKKFSKNGPGSVKLIPEDGEDLWHVFNLVRMGDKVAATTYRKVQRDTGMGTDSERIKLRLMIQVEDIDYDAAGEEIRLKGRNLTENEHVKLGAYHTLELRRQAAFTLEKEVWDGVDLDRIAAASDPAASADLAVLLVGEGLANLSLVGANATVLRARVETSMPRKKGAAAAGRDKAVHTFQSRVYQAVLQHVDWDVVKCLVVAGPGFVKDQFLEFLFAEAQRREDKVLMAARSKIVVAPASTAFQHSLKEVLAVPAVAAQIKDTKAAKEVAAMADFYAMMSSDPARAFYGPGHVWAAHELGAIATLLISEGLFRTSDVAARRKYVALVDEVAAGGGQVMLFSDMHGSGQQLQALTGLAAILRFPLPELEDTLMDEGVAVI
ncbi:hypothetical protein ACKKBG_A23685 [Auxenochlorella protothecoides x Auxenochlorella symbiontica]